MSELTTLLRLARVERNRGETLLLATVVRVEGSAYRRPGARMLLSPSRWLAGSISGGCLEADVVQRGAWRTRKSPAVVTRYDATSDDGDPRDGFGFGAGALFTCSSNAWPTGARATRSSLPPGSSTRSAAARSSRSSRRSGRPCPLGRGLPWTVAAQSAPTSTSPKRLGSSRRRVEAPWRVDSPARSRAPTEAWRRSSRCSFRRPTCSSSEWVTTPSRWSRRRKASGGGCRSGASKGASKRANALPRRIGSWSCRNESALVVGCSAEEVATSVSGLDLARVDNPNWELGMGTSVHAAVQWAIERKMDALVLCVCDQPHISRATVNALVSAHAAGFRLVGSLYEGVLGVPALFSSRYYEPLLRLAPERGAAALLRPEPDGFRVPWPEGALDVDTEADAARLR